MHSNLKNIFVKTIIFFAIIIFVAFVLSFFLKYDLNRKIFKTNEVVETVASKPIDFSDLQVKIINRAGVPRLAREMKVFLLNFDLKEIEVGTDTNLIDESFVNAYSKDSQSVKYIADLVCLDKEKIYFLSNDSNFKNLCVINIGKDYRFLKPFRK